MSGGICPRCFGRLDMIWPHYRIIVRDDAEHVAVDTRVCANCVERAQGVPLVIPFPQDGEWHVRVHIEAWPPEQIEPSSSSSGQRAAGSGNSST